MTEDSTHFIIDNTTNKIVVGGNMENLNNEAIKKVSKDFLVEKFPDRSPSEFKIIPINNMERYGIDVENLTSWAVDRYQGRLNEAESFPVLKAKPTVALGNNRGIYKVGDILTEGRKFQLGKGYTHFAVRKLDGKIMTGWDYKGYDASELREFKRDYFTMDLIDWFPDNKPSEFTILGRKTLERQGIDVADTNNWFKESTSSDAGGEGNLGEEVENQNPTRISQEEAENLLNTTHNFIYLNTQPSAPLDSTANTFMINDSQWDGSLNIYTNNATPKEYGLGNIIKWLRERGDSNVEFYTLYSDEGITFP